MLKTVSTLSSGGTSGGLTYQGAWNASTNTPTLTSGVGTNGYYYVVSVAGTTTLNGVSLWSVGDWAIFNGTTWQKLDGSNTEAFTSITVTGLTGYMYANNTSPVTASTTIPVANVAGAVANTINIIAGTGLSGGGALTGNVTLTNAGVTSFNTRNGAVTLTSSDITTALGYTPGTGNGTVTNVATGTGLTGGPITTTGTIAIANTAVTAGTYGNASNVAQVTINAQGQVTNAVNVAISIANSAVTGLGTMATQNANAVVITGGNATLTTITANNHVATANITTTANLGSYSYGTLGYSDVNIFASYAANLTSYAQVVLQNANNGATASVDFVVSNDQGSSSANYGDFGINSSGFSGTGNFNKAGAVYLYAASTDISIGTWSANAIHFIAGGNTNADAMTVNANNTVTIATLAQSTSSTATFATSSLPLVPAGYIIVNNNGTNVKIPYYAV